ncbi:2-(1,2-epoxy-1,2-dihydrophenyl)acetyl-CoA isomerase PaaG [uncultured Maritalea sp.]|uniref:2-(1,2-epoxy-1,2-dihydrophenyl)acetyl-CoA isomerase PaaG n=1 Tax=uncultured Maritalea sp. TaxID=757249 RepID=UPI0026283B15|nr:2-(1,2-epoxy-1,2-dihydrophenyl)acetyl-CoA isomerase PaaG [uncultured Maritalea sp.]
MSDTIIVTKNAGWVEITLNRPDRLNAFNDEMHGALQSALRDAKDDKSVRAILFTGAGRGFCAGQDLDARDPRKMTSAPDLHATISTFYNPLVKLIRSINKPIICAVNGVAAGAGVNIALGCDIVLAAESAKFIQSFAKVGLVPDAGGSWILPRLIGEARAKYICLTATPVPAKQAVEWGMIWQVIHDEQLMDDARKLAAQMAEGPTFGLGMMKQALQSSFDHSLDEHLDVEAEMQGRCGRSKDYAEGVSAFLDKRPTNFGGVE